MQLISPILQSLIDLDTSLLLVINGAHCDFFDYFMYEFSAKLVWVPFYVAIFYTMIKNFTKRELLFAVVGIGMLILLADQVCSSLIRPLVERWRPSNPNSPIADLVHIVNGYRGGRYGFPSCHATNTFALATYVSLLFRNRWLTGFLLFWALVTCYSRAYLGVHYPGDLLVGGAIGVLLAILIYKLFARLSDYSRPKAPKQVLLPVWVGVLSVLCMLIFSALA